jgi:diguanylate cyclase (GGDEF)-like protein
MNGRHNLYRRMLLAALAAALLGSIVYLLVLVAGGADLLQGHRQSVTVYHPEPWLIVALAAGALMTVAWVLADRSLSMISRLARSERAAREAAEELRARLRVTEEERARLETERDEERAARENMAAARDETRDWNQKLRAQVARMQRERGALGRHDVREMVLELTMQLAEAEKGVLLSDRETTSGKLRVVCALGFENDPQDSALAQRFASEVIERDTTVREDGGVHMDSARRTAADEEVQNLLAIPVYVTEDFAGVIVCANRKGGFDHLEDDVLLAIGDHAGAVLQNARLHGDLRSAYLSTIRVLADAIELKDPELRGHSDAVSEYVMAVADRLQFEPRRREELIFASLLHDVGKLGISERILLKPARLTDEEFNVMKLHPRIGYQLVRQVPALQTIAPAVLHHHERFDGQGYPGQLSGEMIPLEARIIAVADTFSAMTSDRPYSRARTTEEACAELERCAGGQFDPEVVRLFVEEVRRRPPEALEPDTAAPEPDPELSVHRADGDFVLGARAFAVTDSLTLLYSHRHFHESARAEAHRASLQDRPFAIVVAELVNLGEINREGGFAAGDEVLQSVAGGVQRIAARWRGHGFRPSGRRFAVLVSGADQSAAEEIARSLAHELEPGPAEVVVGAAAWRAGEDGEQVIARAFSATARPTARAA